ncbi:hypothetical protein [Brenneria roseae]|nr:hypothetical protein [Brenneria roseae]
MSEAYPALTISSLSYCARAQFLKGALHFFDLDSFAFLLKRARINQPH